MHISVIHIPDHRLAVARVPLARQYADVRLAERCVAQRVQHRIDQRVDVAQRIERVPQLLRYAVVAVVRQRLDQHKNVVRRPRQDEAEQDRGQRARRLRLLALLLRLFLLLHLARRLQALRDDFGVQRNANVHAGSAGAAGVLRHPTAAACGHRRQTELGVARGQRSATASAAAAVRRRESIRRRWQRGELVVGAHQVVVNHLDGGDAAMLVRTAVGAGVAGQSNDNRVDGVLAGGARAHAATAAAIALLSATVCRAAGGGCR